jgi:hypothetical protein
MSELDQPLSHLTTSGWVLFACTVSVLLCFVARIAKRPNDEMAWVLGILIAWLLWLVTP